MSAASFATLVAGCGSEAQREVAPVLRVMRPVDGPDQYAQTAQKYSDTSDGKYRLKCDIPAKQTDGQRFQLTHRIVGGGSSLDIMGLDVVWTPEFAEVGWAFPLPEDMAERVTGGMLSGLLDTATWQGRLYDTPLNTSTQLLQYRKSLVDGPPKMQDDLITSGERLADEGKSLMTDVQATQYEDSVVWLNSMTVSVGGQLAAPDGQSATTADNDTAERTLDIMHHVAAAKGRDPSVSQSDENQAHLVFDHDDVLVQVNYLFVYTGTKEKAESGNQMVKEVFEDTAWTTHPAMDGGTLTQVTIGGLNPAMPSTSKYPELASEAIDRLYNEQNQSNNALKGGLSPTLTKPYTQATDDSEEEYLFYRGICEQLNTLEESDLAELTQEERALLPSPRTAGVVTRPKFPAYQSSSILMASRISPPKDVDARSLVSTLSEELQTAINSEGLAL